MKNKIIWTLLVVLNLHLLPLDADGSDAVTRAAEKALPSIVFVVKQDNPFDHSYGENAGYYEYFRPFYEWIWPSKYCHGSGFIMSPDGYIVTNEHVVRGGSSFLVVLQDVDLRVCKATLIGSDQRTDVAVLKIENEDGEEFPYLQFGDSNEIKLGEQVLVAGNPLRSELESSVTMGIVSGKNRNDLFRDRIEGYIQTDAAMNGGNSGGPLLNLDADVIGIVTWNYSTYYGFAGLGFCVPSHIIQQIAKQLISNGKVAQGFLGVELEKLYEKAFDVYCFDSNDGAHIQKVLSNSPAEKAGLKEGDVIVAVNEIPIQNHLDLRNEVAILEPNTKIDLVIYRDDEVLEKTVKLGSDELSKKYSSISHSAKKIVL